MVQIHGPSSNSRPNTSDLTRFLTAAALADEINRLFMSSLASITAKAYSVDLKAFNQFREAQKLGVIWPPPLKHILMFMAHLSTQGCKQATAKSYIAATAFKFKVLGSCDPIKHFLVSKLVAGMKRQNNNRDLRMPIK